MHPHIHIHKRFQARLQNCEELLLASCLSVHLYKATRLPLDWIGRK